MHTALTLGAQAWSRYSFSKLIAANGSSCICRCLRNIRHNDEIEVDRAAALMGDGYSMRANRRGRQYPFIILCGRAGLIHQIAGCIQGETDGTQAGSCLKEDAQFVPKKEKSDCVSKRIRNMQGTLIRCARDGFPVAAIYETAVRIVIGARAERCGKCRGWSP